ncbi:MAG TPA: hypothetical protein DF712_03135, partial [Balneola sp.]|nr:hypothetical protein [Balneola sp.]
SGGQTSTVFQSSEFSTGANSLFSPSSTALPEINAVFTAIEEDDVFVDILVTEKNTVPEGTTFSLTSSGSNFGELQFVKSNAI